MPTVLEVDGYRFFFWSNEGTEPRHVHVERGDGYGKWWLEPVKVDHARGFKKAEQRRVHEIVHAHREDLIRAWNEHFQ